VGVDQIVFEVPDGVEGCYQQVLVKIGNIVSNYATMSISSTGDECAADGGTITLERVRAAQAREWATYACMTLYRECEESFLPGQGETCEDGLTASFGRADLGSLDLSRFHGDKLAGACAVYTFAPRARRGRGQGSPGRGLTPPRSNGTSRTASWSTIDSRFRSCASDAGAASRAGARLQWKSSVTW